MTKGARYPLPEVRRLIEEKRYWFPAKPRSIHAVISVFEDLGTGIQESEAVSYILEAVSRLKTADFCESVLQWNDPKCIADVYGIMKDGHPWYVKLRIDDNELEEISFHPPEKQMRLANGKMIPAGKKTYGT